jgi:hypothetical protein
MVNGRACFCPEKIDMNNAEQASNQTLLTLIEKGDCLPIQTLFTLFFHEAFTLREVFIAYHIEY